MQIMNAMAAFVFVIAAGTAEITVVLLAPLFEQAQNTQVMPGLNLNTTFALRQSEKQTAHFNNVIESKCKSLCERDHNANLVMVDARRRKCQSMNSHELALCLQDISKTVKWETSSYYMCLQECRRSPHHPLCRAMS